VLASVAAVYLAMEKGISFAFALGAACYLVAGLLAQELWHRAAGELRLAPLIQAAVAEEAAGR
jgi:uncharacterized membrane protein YhhN